MSPNKVKTPSNGNHDKPVVSVNFSSDATLLVSGSGAYLEGSAYPAGYQGVVIDQVWVWDISAGEAIEVYDLAPYVHQVAFIDNDNFIAVGAIGDPRWHVNEYGNDFVERSTGNYLNVFPEGVTYWNSGILYFNQEQNWLVLQPNNIVWDWQAQEQIANLPIDYVFHDAGFSKDSHLLITVTDHEDSQEINSPVLVWDTQTWQVIAEFGIPHDYEFTKISLHPHANLATVISKENLLYLLNLETGQIVPFSSDFSGSITSLEFYPAQDKLLADHNGFGAWEWDVTSPPINHVIEPNKRLWSVRLDATGQRMGYIAIENDNCNLYIIEINTSHVLLEFTGMEGAGRLNWGITKCFDTPYSFHPDQKTLALLREFNLEVWNIEANQQQRTLLRTSAGYIGFLSPASLLYTLDNQIQ